ncbi:BPI fold-containing family B member 2-like [Ascaphus truei]|uniref:BPI fold-containing family B member 2-like n=1 Tax=Ascaphus truei TaxID=8439 RepID=UPI003F590BD5
MMKLLCLAILFVLCAPSMSRSPCKSVLRVKKQAMQYGCQTQRKPLQKEFKIIPFPDISQRTGGGLFGIGGVLNLLVGNVLKVAGIQILDVQLPELQVNLLPAVGLQVSVETSLHIKANVLLIGGIELMVGSGVLADVQVSKTSKGFPILSVRACKSVVGDLQVIVGGQSIIPAIVNIIRGHIHAILTDKLCVSFTSVFLRMNGNLALMAGVTPVTGDISLQYTMPSPPVVTDKYMDMDMNIEYTLKDKVIDLPTGDQQDFTLPTGAGSQDSMVNMGFSPDFFISLFTAMHSAGGFNMDISSQFKSFAGQLSTSILGSYIPEISARYPQSLPVQLKIVVSKAPVVTFKSSQLTVNLSPSVEVLVVHPNSRYESLLTISVDALLAAKLDVTGDKLKASLALKGDLSLALASSNIAQCSCKASSLSGYMRTMFEKVFLVQVNVGLSVGVTLPALPNVQLVHPVVDMKDDYAVMSCDLQYNE